MSNLTEGIVTIATAIIGVAILAVLVSRNANTAGVVQSLGSAFSNALGVATRPVAGGNMPINTSYPGGGAGNMGGFSNAMFDFGG